MWKCFTNMEDMVSNMEDMVSHINISQENNTVLGSDHYILDFELQSVSPYHQSSSVPVYVFDYSKGDYDGLNNYLLNVNFSACYNSSDVELIWSFIKSTTSEAMSIFIPTIKLKAAHYPKYFNPSLIHQINCIQSLKRKYHKLPIVTKLKHLEDAKTLLNNQINSAKSQYEK